ncbi:MAG: hypothetical protein Q8N15_03920, partial [Bacillota bacterium]|nr:hypothetical protein [Bacillota bacterium]
MFFFRKCDRWFDALLAYPPLVLGWVFTWWGAWDLELPMMIFSICFRPLPYLLPLFLDRWAHKRLSGLVATLVFPAAMVAMDFALSFTPFATVLSGVVG